MIAYPISAAPIAEKWWTLNENYAGTQTYFEAKLHSTNVSTTSDKIHFNVKIAINCKSVLPPGFVVASFAIPDFGPLEGVPLVPVQAQNPDNDWAIHEINVSIPKTSLPYVNDVLNQITVPISVAFACDPKQLDLYKNDFDSLKLRRFLDDLRAAEIKSAAYLDSFFSFATNSGSSELYARFPTTDNPNGTKLRLSWDSKYYLRLSKHEMIREMFTITASAPVTVSNLSAYFYYHIPDQSGYQELTHSETQSYRLTENNSWTFQLPFKVTYSETAKRLVKDSFSGHDFLLPNGGDGYYEAAFDLQTENAHYKVVARNSFRYMLALNDPNALDYFVFDYHLINSLNGFNKLI